MAISLFNCNACNLNALYGNTGNSEAGLITRLFLCKPAKGFLKRKNKGVANLFYFAKIFVRKQGKWLLAISKI